MHSTASENSDAQKQQIDRLLLENAKLCASLESARGLLELAPGFFGLVSPEGRVINLNDRALKSFGANSDQVIGQSFWECPWWTPLPESSHHVRNAIEQAGRGISSQFDLEYWPNQHSGGSKRWVALTLEPCFNERKLVEQISVTGLDVTERFSAEVQVLEVLEGMNDAFFAVDKDWNIIRMNQNHERVTQIKRTDQIGRWFFDIFPTSLEKTSKYWTEFNRAKNDKVPVYFEEYYPVQKIWTSANAYPTASGGMVAFYRDITEQKHAAQNLADEQYKLATIFKESPVAMALFTGREMVIEMVNSKYLELFEGREILNKPLLEALPELAGQGFEELILKVLETGEVYKGSEVLARIKRRTNQYLEDCFFDLTYVRIMDAEGQPYGVYCHALEVTERVLSRRKLEESEERFKQALIGGEIGAWQVDLRTNEVTTSDETASILGVPKFKGNVFEIIDQIIHPEDVSEVNRRWQQAVTDRIQYSQEFRIIHPDKSVHWIFSRGTTKFGADGQPSVFSGVMSDVTDRKVASMDIENQNRILEERVLERTEFLNAILDNLTDGIVACDTHGVLTIFNKATRELHNQNEEAISHDKWAEQYELYHPDGTLMQAEEIPLFRALKEENIDGVRMLIKPRDGLGRLVVCSGRALFDHHKNKIGAVVAMHDISDEIRAQSLERSNTELDRFAAIAAHELQLPLSSINRFTNLLSSSYRGQLDETADEYIDFISNAGKRMTVLIDDLLGYARAGTVDKKRFRRVMVSEIIANVRKNLFSSLEESGTRLTTSAKLPAVSGDEVLLTQLFQNIIANAIKFHKEGLSPQIHLEAVDETDTWIFKISDLGIGMDAKFTAKALELFELAGTEKFFEGSEIGLAVCKKIVTAHGGRIWIESEVSIGSTFLFSLPKFIDEP
ncbi:MAG TPA: PAS domain-containing protein [Bacteriovoracaceae bacterium]|nr:PAS domain-containing protein [Bacteriovoracaceae bacterium]